MGVKILLADSSVSIHKVVELALAEREVELVCVADGEDALERVKEFKPEVVLADIELPRLDGYALCEKIKQDSELAGTSVVLLKPSFAEFDEVRSDEVGTDGLLEKPFSAASLLDAIDTQTSEGAPQPRPAMPVLEEEPEESAETPAAPFEIRDDASFADVGVSGEAPTATGPEAPPAPPVEADEDFILDLDEPPEETEAEPAPPEVIPEEAEPEPAEEPAGEPIELSVPDAEEEPEIITSEPEAALPEEKEPLALSMAAESEGEAEPEIELEAGAPEAFDESEIPAIELAPRPFETAEEPVGKSMTNDDIFDLGEPEAAQPAVALEDHDALVERISAKVMQRLGDRDIAALDDEGAALKGKELIEEIVKRLSDEVIREVAWEVVPDLAESMIKKTLDEITNA